MLFDQLPTDILDLIYEYDATYREYIQKVVLVEMMTVITDRINTHIHMLGNDYHKIYRFLTSGSVNPHLLRYDHNFHLIDQKFFNYHFLRRLWGSYGIPPL
jgi:hypothetical protein